MKIKTLACCCTIFLLTLAHIAMAQPAQYRLTEKQISQLLQKQDKIIAAYQNKKFSSLQGADRDTFLIAMARTAVLIGAPAYYREYKDPIIKTSIVKEGISRNPEHTGKKLYQVLFPSDTAKEWQKGPYIALVEIFADSGEPFLIRPGVSDFFQIFDEKPFTKMRKDHDFILPIAYEQPKRLEEVIGPILERK